MKVDFEEIEVRLKKWYEAKVGLIQNPLRDIVKLTEEAGELAKGTLKGDIKNIREEIGDIGIVLVNISRYYGWSLPELIQEKVGVIEERLRKSTEDRYK